MVKRFKKFDPQLVVVEQLDGSAIALTNEAKLSLYKKSQKSGIPTNILETVYYRGYSIWNQMIRSKYYIHDNILFSIY